MPGTARLAAALEGGIAASRQALHCVSRETPREAGLSLHLGAFAAVALGIGHAYRTEVDLAEMHAGIERALRHVGASWDARPVVRWRRSVLAALLHPDAEPAAVRDSAALVLSLPDLSVPEPGDRGDVLVRCYRRYVDGVYVYCCGRGANTWDEQGRPFALERGLFADLGLAPPPMEEDAGPGLFETLLGLSTPGGRAARPRAWG